MAQILNRSMFEASFGDPEERGVTHQVMGTPKTWMVYHEKSDLNELKWMIWGIHHFRNHPYVCWIQLPIIWRIINLFTVWKSNIASWTMPHL